MITVQALTRMLERNQKGKHAAVAQGALPAIIGLLHPSAPNSASPELRAAVCGCLGAVAADSQEMQNQIASQDGIKLLVDVVEGCVGGSQVRRAQQQ